MTRIPPDVEAPDPDSFEPTSIVNVVLEGIVVTINLLSLKLLAAKLELVIDEKLSNNIISNLFILWSDEKVKVTTAEPLVVLNALVKVVVALIGWIS